MAESVALHVEESDAGWRLTAAGANRFGLVNDYLGYLADRNYSPRTVRAYAFDLLAFARWVTDERLGLDEVTTESLLRFLAVCGADRLAPATVNRRLVAVAGLFGYRAMRDPNAPNPVPRGAERRRTTPAERGGALGHLARPRPASRLRVRQPRRLPRGLERAEVVALLGSFRSWRDKAIAGLMLFSGLRSAEVLGLAVADVDIARGWVRVTGKGGRERRAPIDAEVAGLIQTYLLAERPDTDVCQVFVVAKGAHRGRPLTPAGLRAVFRYHRAKAGVPAAHPHALRHSFGTALAEAGVDLAVIQTLLGHAHVDSSVRYLHLAPRHVRAAYDAARATQRAGA